MARKAVNPGVGRGHGVKEANKECKCIDCGVVFLAKRSDAKRCLACNAKRDRVHRSRPRLDRIKGVRSFTCVDCGTTFTALRVQLRCEACQRIRRNRLESQRELRLRHACIDCGALVFRRTALRCHTCDGKHREAEGLVAGANNPNWKGGRSHKGGYVLVPNTHPEWRKHAYALEHIAVWEEANGKRLPSGHVIHHLNGVKNDNRLENLAAMPRQEHHSHPRQALIPYEQRILSLEARLRELEAPM